MLKRSLKFLHVLSAIGFAGGLTAYMLILANSPDVAAAADYAALRSALALVAKWMIVPSMIVGVCSGLLAMAFHFPFHDEPWVWAKALSGVLIFEASLMSVDAPAQRAAEATAKAVDGEIDAATLASMISDEWVALWVILILAAANVLLAIWRPHVRFGAKPDTGSE
ncbi:MAG: hypothetical protein AB8G17_02610 [Gammaproteobacteria bacterium]